MSSELVARLCDNTATEGQISGRQKVGEAFALAVEDSGRTSCFPGLHRKMQQCEIGHSCPHLRLQSAKSRFVFDYTFP
jgi:hypothetical protein